MKWIGFNRDWFPHVVKSLIFSNFSSDLFKWLGFFMD